MVAGKHRSRSKRRVFVKTPSKTKMVYIDRKPSIGHCAQCGAKLHGMPRVRSSKLTKSQRRPERPYGGQLCSKCSRKTIIERVLEKFKGEGK